MMKVPAGALAPYRRQGRIVFQGFAVAVVAGLFGCGGGGGADNAALGNCPNLPIAKGVVGQSNFVSGVANAGGISSATVFGPFGSLGDSASYSYAADTSNNRILGYNTDPSGTGTPANFELGQGDATGTDFVSHNAGIGPNFFSAPSKVSVSSDNRLVVTDTGNNRVLIWNALPFKNSPPDLVIGQPDFISFRANQKLAAPTAYTLNAPTAAVISNGYLVIADKGNHRVLIWNAVPTNPNTPADVELGQPASTTTTTTTGSGSTATTTTTTNNCTSNTGTTGFCFTTTQPGGDVAVTGTSTFTLGLTSPTDVWTDGYKLLVSDSGNNRVLYWSQMPFNNNGFYSFVIGQTQSAQNASGTGTQHLNLPWGVHSDGVNIFVGDAGNNRVLKYSGFPVQNGSAATGIYGQANFTHVAANDGDQDGLAGTPEMSTSVVTLSDGSTTAITKPTGNNSLNPTSNTLNFPTGVYVTLAGDLYVADSSNHRVLIFKASAAVDGTLPSKCDGINPKF